MAGVGRRIARAAGLTALGAAVVAIACYGATVFVFASIIRRVDGIEARDESSSASWQH